MSPPFTTLLIFTKLQRKKKKKTKPTYVIGHSVEFAAIKEIWSLKQGIGTVREVWIASSKQKDSFHFVLLKLLKRLRHLRVFVLLSL